MSGTSHPKKWHDVSKEIEKKYTEPILQLLKWHDVFKEIEKKYTGPILQLLIDLWVPVFIAVLSFIFFGRIDQTLEIYRIFALSPIPEIIRIICSFISIFFLSLLTWHSGRKLLEKKSGDSNRKRVQEHPNQALKLLFSWLVRLVRRLKSPFSHWLVRRLVRLARWLEPSSFLSRLETWLPRFLGCVPLVALGIGCFRLFLDQFFLEAGERLDDQALFCLVFFVVFSIIVFLAYWKFVSSPEKPPEESPVGGITGAILKAISKATKEPLLFGSRFILLLNFLSIIVVSIFTFPLLTDDRMKAFVIVLMLFLQYLVSLLLKELANSPISRITYHREDRKIILLFFTLSTLILYLVAYFPYFASNPLASNIGPVSVVALFLMVCVFWGSLLFDYGHKTGIPFVIILLTLAIVLSACDWNDNHRLRELSSSPPVENGFPVENSFKDLTTSFNEWIDYPSRKAEIEKFEDNGKPYPIYIVSAQGGGIFAAYHAALTLSQLQDSFPAFASHVFAISGVSGGSLGAAVFSSLINDPFPETKDNVQDNGLGSLEQKAHDEQDNGLGPLAQKAHGVLNHDFLSPLLSAGLFPDFVQRFLPVIRIPPLSALSESVDRARGIEYAFEQAWDKDQKVPYDPQKNNPLRNSFYKHWQPEGTAPALVLNTTVVETGEQLVLSPFKIDLPTLKDIRTVACKNKDDDKEPELDFPLSTAAILSARFPLVTPVGWFERCDSIKDGVVIRQKARLADGGYFENSGISTAYEIGKRLEKSLEEDIKDKKIKVIYLAITNQPSSEIPKAGGFNEVMSPISTSLKTREARGRSAVAQVEYLVNGAVDPNLNFQKKYAEHRFRKFYLHDADPVTEVAFSKLKLPLGWFLSNYSQCFIQKQIGYQNRKDCPDGLTNESYSLTNGSHNTYVFESIKEELDLQNR